MDIGNLAIGHTYEVVCFDKDGKIKWTETAHNLVVTTGLNEILDKYYKGSTYTAAHYVGLKGAGTIAAGDTLASHAGWTELTGYTGNRQALTMGTVSGGSVNNSASKASFPITSSSTVAGAFVCTVASGTSGILIGATDFASARAVENGDTLQVTVTATLTAS